MLTRLLRTTGLLLTLSQNALHYHGRPCKKHRHWHRVEMAPGSKTYMST